jgi:hypothetical protein
LSESERSAFPAEGECGKELVFKRQGATLDRFQKRGGSGGIHFHRPAREIALELAFVAYPFVAVRKRGSTKVRRESNDARAGLGNAPQRIADRGAHGGARIGEERRSEREQIDFRARISAEETRGFVAERGRGIGRELA